MTAVVLAGGTSRRFGSDKLLAPWAGTTLLGHVVGSLPGEWQVVVVGPERPVGRAARFVVEDPPGSGPAAGLAAGVRACATPVVVTLPGDSPYAAQVAALLLDQLRGTERDDTGSRHEDDAVVAAGNPLFLALRGSALATLQNPTRRDANRSGRRLATELDAHPVPIPAELLHDVDTPADL